MSDVLKSVVANLELNVGRELSDEEITKVSEIIAACSADLSIEDIIEAVYDNIIIDDDSEDSES